MKYFTLPTVEAWREIHEALKQDLPVDAVFRMPNDYGSGLQVRVDGSPMNVHINLHRDGTWNATYYTEPLK